MKARILVIDDDANIQIILKFMLDKEFEVIQSFNTTEAFQLLKNEPVDLVITDLNLPGESGLEFVQRLKSENELSSIPVLVLTGLPSSDKQKKAESFGVADFILKPINRQLLLNRVHSLILDNQPEKSSDQSLPAENLSKVASELTELSSGQNRRETVIAWADYLSNTLQIDGLALIERSGTTFQLISSAGKIGIAANQLSGISVAGNSPSLILPGIEGVITVPVTLKSGRDLLIKPSGDEGSSNPETYLLVLKSLAFSKEQQNEIESIFRQIGPVFSSGVS
ncbi:MAG: response regulator [Bacteroidetes bacterium]|nr:response regulator [Bacteroidota bacterium]